MSCPPQRPINRPDAPPLVTFLVGVNGTGKTTTSGKLARLACRAQYTGGTLGVH